MIKFIPHIIVYLFSIVTLFAQVKTEEITIHNKAIQLPGTLSYTSEKSPLIIWVHGSGNVDRNGNQAPTIKANYIQQFRQAINQKNIAFFSYDKRTTNPSNVKFIQEDGIFIDDFADDVKQVIHHFKDDKRFTEIIVIGHSQGSLIAMIALNNVAKYISLAGAGETIDNTVIKQITNQNAALGKLTAQYFKELKETGEIKEVNPLLASLFAKQNQEFLSSWVALNPVSEIKKITIPTLIINGDKDFQVPITNAENLHKAKPDAKLVIIKNMNHVLKEIQKDDDNMKSYYSSDFPISKELIEVISKFIKN